MDFNQELCITIYQVLCNTIYCSIMYYTTIHELQYMILLFLFLAIFVAFGELQYWAEDLERKNHPRK